ncbi:MAG TPA: TraB/GumN family protein [Candidatus Altiarchaeales archaeon]|nr:TraB/GumN family protein [Candidatus Altiarchaeales archaeon]
MLNEVTKVSRDGKEIFLIGAAHVSMESVNLVREVIEEENPDIVAVELDKQRYDSLLNERKWDETEIHNVIRTGRIYLFLLQLLLTNFQRRIGDELGVKPGSEMLKAIELARERSIEIALVDRDIRITLKRAFKKMSLREKFKLFLGFLSGILEEEEINDEILERLKDKDIVTEMMEELSREMPSIKGVLIDERDRYIANKIINLEGEKIVAVVGAGHVDGIKKFIESKNGKKGIDDLEEIPESGNWLRYTGYLIPVVFLSIVGWGFYTNGAELTIEMLYKWFLINGSLSALGVILALGHPLSVITAFLAAPFTSLNPTLAAGWFAGLTEMWVRRPRVKDFDGLFGLKRLRDYWENRVTRVLLVIVFANIGSSIGTFIALPYLALLL